jgi:hypothetical protein
MSIPLRVVEDDHVDRYRWKCSDVWSRVVLITRKLQTCFMKQKHYLELIWWVITVLITIAVLFPIYSSLPSYRFGWINIIYIVSFITVSRYIFCCSILFWPA